jgi:hypothetical protein
MNDMTEELRVKINAETGKLTWKELERFFARGVVVKVMPSLDLVDVAVCIAQDDTVMVEAWLAQGLVARASNEDAASWHGGDVVLWAVVAAPWILVQEVAERPAAH